MRKTFPYIIIAAVIFLVFSNTFFFPVMNAWDDNIFVTEIAEYLNFRPASIIHLLTIPSLGNYIPLVNLSYAVDHSIGGLDGFMYHFQNVLWHIAACCGLFGCIRLLGVSNILALLVVLLYSVHPQRTESVAWVAERRDVMCGAFYFWSAFCYLKFRERKMFPFSAFILFLCACLSKPVAVTMPITLVMYEIWRCRSVLPLPKYRWIIPYFAVSAIVSVGTSVLQLNPPSGAAFFEKLLKVFHNFSWYFLKNIYPGEMAPVYPKLLFDGQFFLKVSLFYFALLVLICFIALRYRKFFIYSLIPFMIAYAASLLPTIGFVPIGTGAWDYADRYSYIPSAILAAGAALLLASAAGKFPHWKKFFQIEVLALSLMILLFSWITFFYNYAWKSYSDLVAVTVLHDPPNRNFLCMYAVNMLAENKNDEAGRCADYLLSVENKNNFDHNRKSIYYTAMAVKAAVLDRRGHLRDALALFDESFGHIDEFVFQNSKPYTKLLETAAGCYLRTGHKKKALRCYDLIAANFEYENESRGLFHFYKGISFHIKGNLKMAESEFSKSTVFFPDDENIKMNLEQIRNSLKKNRDK